MTITKDRDYRLLTFATFGLLWLYVFLRAIYVSPLHDEVATYFHFIETGKIWGEDAQLDANNHLLNSLFGKISYRLFGESFFLFRLPNVLAFALYFWGIRHLLRDLKPWFQYICLIGITSIPYVLEYFAYTRGYGLSITCFTWVLIFAQKLTKQFSLLNLAGLYFFAFAAILSNVSFLTTGCLAVLLTIVLFLRNVRQLSWVQISGFILLTALFFLACKPLVELSMVMKEAGTLYYGSLEGLWDVTGKTLFRYVFFTDHDVLAIVISVLLVVLLIVQLWKLISLGLWNYLRRADGLFAFFFFGLLTLIVIMAEAFKINYPEDRVAMQLIPLFLLLVITTIYHSKTGEKALYLFLLFPLSLILHLSLSTSVFTPDERLTDDFYRKVKKQLKPESSLSGYPTMQLTWALHERNVPVKNFMHLETSFRPNADIVLVKSALTPKNTDLSGYAIIAEDREASYIAYKRKTAFGRRPLFRIGLEQLESQNEYIDLARFSPQSNWQNKPLLISVKATVKRALKTDLESIVISSTKTSGEAFRYESYDLRWYNSIHPDEITFEMTYEFTALDAQESDFVVYLWNKRFTPMKVSNCTVYIYSLQKAEE